MTLNFDTGSPVTWVNPDCSKVPDERSREKEFCLKQPRYDPFTSNTAKIQNQALNLTYGRGSILGSYFTDDIRIGSVVAESATFGVAAASTEHEVGIFGAGKSPEGYPPTVLETLVSQGKINSHAFSVDLKSINETGQSKVVVDSATVVADVSQPQARWCLAASTRRNTRVW